MILSTQTEKVVHVYIWQKLFLAGWKKYSFERLLAMIIFDMMEVSSIKLVTSVIVDAKFHRAGLSDLPNSS